MPNEDLAQETRIGIFKALKKDPDANTTYLKQTAKWQISNSLKKGEGVLKLVEI
jgi:DNA-directed RNA polymerase specialized sigma24 family protein